MPAFNSLNTHVLKYKCLFTPSWLLKLGTTLLIHNKDDIEFVTEFPCFLGHPVSLQPSVVVLRYFQTKNSVGSNSQSLIYIVNQYFIVNQRFRPSIC